MKTNSNNNQKRNSNFFGFSDSQDDVIDARYNAYNDYSEARCFERQLNESYGSQRFNSDYY